MYDLIAEYYLAGYYADDDLDIFVAAGYLTQAQADSLVSMKGA